MLTGSDPPSGPCSTPSSSPDSRRPARRKRGRAHSHRDGCASPSRGPAGASRGARLQSSPQALTGSVALELARRVPPASCPGGCTCPSPRAAMKTDSSEKPSHSLPVVRLPRYTTHDTRRKTRRGEPGEGGRGRGRAAHTTGSHQPSATRSAAPRNRVLLRPHFCSSSRHAGRVLSAFAFGFFIFHMLALSPHKIVEGHSGIQCPVLYRLRHT